MKNGIKAAAFGAFSICAATTAAFAGSELQPGISTGIALGAPLPEGVFVLTLPNYGYRDTTPGTNVGALVPAWVIWSTPWSLFGGKLMFDAASPMVNANVHGVINQGGFMNPIVDAQLKWDLGNGFFGGFQTGVYLPVDNEMSNLGIARNFASFQGIIAFSYLKDGWNISMTNIYGTGQSGNIYSAAGSYAPSWYNLDFTATKKFGKFEFGLVAFGSADLDKPISSYAKQSQIALGGLVGYDFGVLDLQFKFTRDVMEQGYGGYDTRGWANIIIPLWVAAPPKAAVAAKY